MNTQLGIAYDALTEYVVFEEIMSLLLPVDRYSFVVALGWLFDIEMSGKLAVEVRDGDLTIVTVGYGTFYSKEGKFVMTGLPKCAHFCDNKRVSYGCVQYRNANGKMQRNNLALTPSMRYGSNTVGGKLTFMDDEVHLIATWVRGSGGARRQCSGRVMYAVPDKIVDLKEVKNVVIFAFPFEPIPLSYPRGFEMMYVGMFGEQPPSNLKGGWDWRVQYMMALWCGERFVYSMADSYDQEKDTDWIEFLHDVHFTSPFVCLHDGVRLMHPIGRMDAERKIAIWNEYAEYGERHKYIKDWEGTYTVMHGAHVTDPPLHWYEKGFRGCLSNQKDDDAESDDQYSDY